MPSDFDWQPVITSIWILLAFVGMCFLAVVGDIWAKGNRPKRTRRQPVEWVNGEKVYLN